MRRRPAAALAVLAAAACVAEVFAISGHLRAERRAANERTLAAKEKLAAAGAKASSRARGKETEELCLRDVDTAAVAAAEAEGALGDRRRPMDVETLAEISERALMAERAIERTGGMPQRLGREYTGGRWKALEPETVSCRGAPAAAKVPVPPQGRPRAASGAK